MKYVAFIPARGGSKGIPGKNVKALADKPLIAWSIEAALSCPYIDQVYVATDAAYIKDAVEKLFKNKVYVIDRSPETTTDIASSESALLEFCSKYIFDFVFFIQATSPLLTSTDLTQAINLQEKGSFDSIFSATRQKRFIWNVDNEGTSTPINYSPQKRPRRQDFEGFFVENGAFYLSSRTAILNSKCRLSGKIGCLEMGPETYVELDEPEDWLYVENILRNK